MARYTVSRDFLSAPHEVPDNTRSRFSGLVHLVLTCWICGIQVNLWSRIIIPKNLTWFEKVIWELPKRSVGSVDGFRFLEKRMACVFSWENLKPVLLAHSWRRLRILWMISPIIVMQVNLTSTAKSSTKRKANRFAGSETVMALIAIPKRTQLSTLPCGIPLIRILLPDRLLPTLTRILLLQRKFLINFARFPLKPHLCSCSRIRCRQVVSYACFKSKNNPIASSFLRTYLVARPRWKQGGPVLIFPYGIRTGLG